MSDIKITIDDLVRCGEAAIKFGDAALQEARENRQRFLAHLERNGWTLKDVEIVIHKSEGLM